MQPITGQVCKGEGAQEEAGESGEAVARDGVRNTPDENRFPWGGGDQVWGATERAPGREALTSLRENQMSLELGMRGAIREVREWM